jgi:Na+-transporting methylmalonyl-CoA/oxaloacetate decarboxylase gamma subunit
VSSITDLELVFEIFYSGILGVFIVMIILMLAVMASSAIIQYFEKRRKNNVDTVIEVQKSTNGGGR